MIQRSFDHERARVHLGIRTPRSRALPILTLAGALVLNLLANQAAAQGVPIEAREPEAAAESLVLRKSSFAIDACRLIDRVSRANAIPGDYIARLISVESGFSPTAVSPKGAQGIAQFMWFCTTQRLS
jgi:soluble lytic murein transglycosylase-like protein